MGRGSLLWSGHVFGRISGVPYERPGLVAGFPCALRGVYAHGSGVTVLIGIRISHDSAILLDPGGERVCKPDGLAPAGSSWGAEPARRSADVR